MGGASLVFELIWSNGGPLIMLAENLLPWWGGIENCGGLASTDRQWFTSGVACDYDRAGAVEGWIGEVPIQDGAGVVFWGDHIGLSLLSLTSSKLLVIRPWYHEDDLDSRVAAAVEQLPPLTPNFSLSVTTGRFAVFDSAHPGFDIRPPMLWADLRPGNYQVATSDKASARSLGITLHLIEGKD